MGLKLDRWTTAGSAALVLAVLLACKKSEDKAPEPVASAAPPASAAPEPVKEPEDAGAKEEKAEAEIKRYADKEKEEEGKVKVLVDKLDVFAEADDKGKPIATLEKDTEVELKASYETYYLIEFAAMPGKPHTGWVNATDKGVVSSQTEAATVPKKKVKPKAKEDKEEDKAAEKRRRRRRKKKSEKEE